MNYFKQLSNEFVQNKNHLSNLNSDKVLIFKIINFIKKRDICAGCLSNTLNDICLLQRYYKNKNIFEESLKIIKYFDD
jgi:hypothetical protein